MGTNEICAILASPSFARHLLTLPPKVQQSNTNFAAAASSTHSSSSSPSHCDGANAKSSLCWGKVRDVTQDRPTPSPGAPSFVATTSHAVAAAAASPPPHTNTSGAFFALATALAAAATAEASTPRAQTTAAASTVFADDALSPLSSSTPPPQAAAPEASRLLSSRLITARAPHPIPTTDTRLAPRSRRAAMTNAMSLATLSAGCAAAHESKSAPARATGAGSPYHVSPLWRSGITTNAPPRVASLRANLRTPGARHPAASAAMHTASSAMGSPTR
mmetsp:Transcript_37958/g.94052  ORF Transcript_37958/g.94052 Transcript_37958/m.94052 type:complete len:276 (-) Transcript_37958:1452-2279(-)